MFLAFIVLFLASCQKVVHINLGNSPPVVVIQGQIQTDQPPYVLLNSSISFFSNVNLSNLENSFLHNAKVTVSDGVKTITLKEYALDTGINNKVYIYSVDTTNLSNFMVGVAGKFYTLTVQYNGNTYTSVTKIPYPKGVDTMWFAKPLFSNKRTPDSALELFVNYSDPDSQGNYVRAFTRKNNQNYYPTQTYSDEAVNGIQIKNIGILAGYEDSTNVKTDTVRYFYPGDTVYLNWCQIDRGVYNFWNSEAYANQVIGDPFASPINIQTNIKGGAIGVWAGYSSSISSKIVTK